MKDSEDGVIMVWIQNSSIEKVQVEVFCFLMKTAWCFIRNRFCFFLFRNVGTKKESRVESKSYCANFICLFYFWQCTVRHYHGSLGHDERQSAHVAFLNGTAPVIVATVAFGMGIGMRRLALAGEIRRRRPWGHTRMGCPRLPSGELPRMALN